MDKLRRALSGNDVEDEESGFVAQVVDSSTLSWGTRVKGFAACFIIGILLSVLGSICLFFGPKGLISFSIFYTLGNVVALCSTCFLMGPINQCKKMFSSTRVVATVLMVICLVLTMLSAFLVRIRSIFITPLLLIEYILISETNSFVSNLFIFSGKRVV